MIKPLSSLGKRIITIILTRKLVVKYGVWILPRSIKIVKKIFRLISVLEYKQEVEKTEIIYGCPLSEQCEDY